MCLLSFLYVKVNSKEIGEEILLPSFSRKMLMSTFMLRFKANHDYLEKNVWLSPFFFLDSKSFWKDLLFLQWSQFGAKISIFSRHRP